MKALLKNLLAALFWAALWYALALLVDNPLLLPTPWQVLARLGELAMTGAFWYTLLCSLGRVLLGILSGVALGAALAVASVRFAWVHTLVSPVMTALQASPVASFSVLVLIWLSRGLVPVVICAMIVLPVVWSQLCQGIRSVDPQLLELARAYGLPGGRILKRIWLPGVLPSFRTACSNAVGLGWKAGVAAEVLTVPGASIGRMISDAKLYLETQSLFAWTLAAVALSLLLKKVMLLLIGGRNDHA